jgi:uridine kinase
MYVIGITGGTCSGKTTLTSELNEKLQGSYKIKVLHMDGYFKSPPPNTIAPFTLREYVDHNHPDSFRTSDFYAAVDEALGSDADIVIIEGLLILHLDYIREKCDLKVFVDLRSDERLLRRIHRFQRDRGQSLDEIADRYLDTVRFRHDEFIEPTRWYADVVINGNLDRLKGAEVLYAYIESKVNGK